ncbi:MAG: ABC transporter ATP-binding protein [Deltaproteobacteria bacterium]|nr:ABC transporter ATP-binding protein [Deltaproteobacteria bacterium]
MEPVLQIDDLKKSFGALEAVRGLTLAVHPGEIVGLVGPDGAGKTTTMRMVAGLVTPNAGSIRILQTTIGAAPSPVRAQMGYMPQQYSLYGDLSVEENLRFFAGMYGLESKVMLAREHRLLGIARLEEFRDRPAAALSGGMYKKLALSCALVHEPRLLLLDEPTNGVDPISRRELWALLREQVGEGVGVLISTPYMDEAARCDRVALLVDGALVAFDTPAALATAFAATILELVTEPALGTPAALEALAAVDQIYTVGRKIHLVTHDPTTVQRAVRDQLAAQGVRSLRLEVVAPTFEDIFLSLSSAKSSEVRR